ncbi:hypothetical protein NliqN6_3262 [Naganishia liquefaciens]|uniref:Uncharacterized protein n=1 Tax=Naganishia liquefaciens TaxID=104408 RepID=A0A8H3YER2_9TREE|nr:hypothetical protein NliqN6_3262 [Naganishia liquefaciens]
MYSPRYIVTEPVSPIPSKSRFPIIQTSPYNIPLSPPVPSRKAPNPPRKVPRSWTRNGTRKHMKMIEPECVGLWTVDEVPEEFADAEEPAEVEDQQTTCQMPRRPSPRLRELTSQVDQNQWRVPCSGKRAVGLGIQGFTGPEEVFDGLFWVAPQQSNGQIDSPTASEESFGTSESPSLDATTSPCEAVAPHQITPKPSWMLPPPLSITLHAPDRGLPEILQSPFTPTAQRRKPTPLAESPAREGILRSPSSWLPQAFQTPCVTSTNAPSISTCSSSSSSFEDAPPLTPPMTADIGSIAMQRSQGTGNSYGKPLEWAFERFLALAEGSDEDVGGDDEWYLPAPATPIRRLETQVPSAPKKAGPLSHRGAAIPRSCRALQDITGLASSAESLIGRRPSLPCEAVSIGASLNHRRASDGFSSEAPLVIDFVLDVPRGTGRIITPFEKQTAMGENRRGLPKRKALPTLWVERTE